MQQRCFESSGRVVAGRLVVTQLQHSLDNSTAGFLQQPAARQEQPTDDCKKQTGDGKIAIVGDNES